MNCVCVFFNFCSFLIFEIENFMFWLLVKQVVTIDIWIHVLLFHTKLLQWLRKIFSLVKCLNWFRMCMYKIIVCEMLSKLLFDS